MMQKYLISVYLVPDPQNRNLRTKSELYIFTFLMPLLPANPLQIKKDLTAPRGLGQLGTLN